MRGDTSSSPFKKLQQQIRIQRCQLPTAPPYTSQNSASLQHIPGNRLSSFALESFSLSFTVFLTNSNTVGSFELASTTQLYNPTRLFTKKKLLKVYPPGSSNTCRCPVTQRLVLRGWSTKGCPRTGHSVCEREQERQGGTARRAEAVTKASRDFGDKESWISEGRERGWTHGGHRCADVPCHGVRALLNEAVWGSCFLCNKSTRNFREETVKLISAETTTGWGWVAKLVLLEKWAFLKWGTDNMLWSNDFEVPWWEGHGWKEQIASRDSCCLHSDQLQMDFAEELSGTTEPRH